MYLHEESLRRFGGSIGLRDEGQVESAVGSAMNTWFYGSRDLYDVAATYAFHIAESQAFVDGNKRTGAAAALTFLAKNGKLSIRDDGTLYQAMIDIADHKLDKAGLAAIFRGMTEK
ncbi:type II toxin-antitoxin system death-on-curing family toxin [bacterium]|nr:type II toxin-antitoxin system death-on-curing family toxin [bacterium]